MIGPRLFEWPWSKLIARRRRRRGLTGATPEWLTAHLDAQPCEHEHDASLSLLDVGDVEHRCGLVAHHDGQHACDRCGLSFD